MNSGVANHLKDSLSNFLPYLEEPDFYGTIVSTNSGLFYVKGGIFDKAVKLFSDKDLNFTVNMQPRLIKFESGAVIGFTSVENTVGMHLSVAMIIDSPNLTFRDIQWIRTRLRRPCVDMGRYWFININNI